MKANDFCKYCGDPPRQMDMRGLYDGMQAHCDAWYCRDVLRRKLDTLVAALDSLKRVTVAEAPQQGPEAEEIDAEP